MPSAHDIVDTCRSLISLPEIYVRVREVIEDPYSSMDDLANALSLDPSMTARVLRIVNSPLYGIPHKIGTLSQAVNLLGMRPISHVVFATNVAKAFARLPSTAMNMTEFWRKSVLCALIAVHVARASRMQECERLFVAGLLRDVGHLVLYQTLSERAHSAFVEAIHVNRPLADIERAAFGCDYAEVGGELMKTWGMPSRLEQAIRYQLTPMLAPQAEHDAAVLYAAGALADQIEQQGMKAVSSVVLPPEVSALLKLSGDEVAKLSRNAQKQLKETLAVIYPAAIALAA